MSANQHGASIVQRGRKGFVCDRFLKARDGFSCCLSTKGWLGDPRIASRGLVAVKKLTAGGSVSYRDVFTSPVKEFKCSTISVIEYK
jgi:hypothetical protein